MKQFASRAFVELILGLSLFTWQPCLWTAQAVATSDTQPGWVGVLENEGYVVQKGVHSFFDLESCKAEGKSTCYANNPLTPYGLTMLPRAPGELEFGYSNWCANSYSGCKYTLNDQGKPVSWNWRVKKGEVMLVVGTTPPECRYFSWTPYLYSRYHGPRWHSGMGLSDGLMNMFYQCPPTGPMHGSRCDSYAGINDPLNMLDLVTLEPNKPNKFDAKFALMLSWDSSSEQNVSRLLPFQNVNHLRFPGKWSRMGVDSGEEDDFTMMYRVEGVKNATAAKAYFKANPISVFRITPRSLNITAVNEALFPSFQGKMKTRWTGEKERAPGVGHDQLLAAMKELTQSVRRAYSSRTVETAIVPFVVPVNGTKYDVIEKGGRAMGEHSDSLFAIGSMVGEDDFCKVFPMPFYCWQKKRSGKLSTDPDDALILVGVNHKAAGFALYSSITLYTLPKMGSIKSLKNDQMGGSVDKYMNRSHAAAPYLFVHKFARSCPSDDAFCTVVPWNSTDPAQLNAALDDQLWFMERLYLRENPSTSTSPIPEETIMSVLIHVADKRVGQEQSFESLQAE